MSQFKEEFLKKGAEGGRQAAKMLVEKVQQETGPDGMVVVHVFVNMEGFRKTLLLNRLVDSEYTLTEFVDGFEHAKKNVDLIDAGSRKGAADRKILGEQPISCEGLTITDEVSSPRILPPTQVSAAV